MVAKLLYFKKRATSAHPVTNAMPMARRFFPCALAKIDDDALELMDKVDDLTLTEDREGAVFDMGLCARAIDIPYWC